jgi:hypothetical protein
MKSQQEYKSNLISLMFFLCVSASNIIAQSSSNYQILPVKIKKTHTAGTYPLVKGTNEKTVAVLNTLIQNFVKIKNNSGKEYSSDNVNQTVYSYHVCCNTNKFLSLQLNKNIITAETGDDGGSDEPMGLNFDFKNKKVLSIEDVLDTTKEQSINTFLEHTIRDSISKIPIDASGSRTEYWGEDYLEREDSIYGPHVYFERAEFAVKQKSLLIFYSASRTPHSSITISLEIPIQKHLSFFRKEFLDLL